MGSKPHLTFKDFLFSLHEGTSVVEDYCSFIKDPQLRKACKKMFKRTKGNITYGFFGGRGGGSTSGSGSGAGPGTGGGGGPGTGTGGGAFGGASGGGGAFGGGGGGSGGGGGGGP